MDKNKCSSCGEAPHECSCKNKEFTKAVIEIDNPEQITLMRKIIIPASMGDDTTVPPVVGKYKNVLLFYEANSKSYLYSSDGIPTLLANGITDYEQAVNLPEINGVTLLGNKSGEDLGLQDKLVAGDGIDIDSDNTISISDIEQYAHFFDTVADMKAATNLVAGDYARTSGFYAVNDGGGALYEITDTGVANEMDVISVGVLYATIITGPVCTPEMFGAYGDKTNDDTDAIQTAINTSTEVKLDKEYLVNGSLSLKNGSHLFGAGTLYQPNNVDEKLINIDDASGIIIEGLTICNDSGQTGTPANYAGQYLIYVEDSSDIIIRDCHFKNAYKRGIEIFKSKDIVYDNNTFVNATFDMLMLLPEVENVKVTNSIFDTITSSLTVAYLFATGSYDNETIFEFSTKNILVDNCKFLNNPLWEGIDTHGCNGFTCTNNYVYNCYRGIMAHYDTSIKTSSTIKHDNLVFKNNILEGTNISAMSAIITGGKSTYFSKNITIENNKADNWGANATNNNASIHVENAKYVDIINNSVTNSKGSHLYTSNITYGNVIGNYFIETSRNIATLIYTGSWFINFKNNVIRNLKSNKVQAINMQGIIQIEGNEIEGFTTPFYGVKTNMTGTVSQYTTQMGKIGYYVRNGAQLPTHYCTDTVVKANKAETLAITATINNGSYTVETSGSYTSNLCEGQEIIIVGAGPAAANLTTVITEVIDETHFTVRDSASTSVAGANISVTASTWVAV